VITGEQRAARQYAAEQLAAAGIVLTKAERDAIEIADFGLSRLQESGLLVLVYVDTGRYCARGSSSTPARRARSTVTHRSTTVPSRNRRSAAGVGSCAYVEGEPSAEPACTAPAPQGLYTAGHEIRLEPVDRYTIPPNTLHWFQSGPEGAVVTEFSSASRDELDVFSDPAVRGATVVSG
jgi:D-lyxose ketol-isomerase